MENDDNLLALLLFERYIPAMSEEELYQLRAGRVDWDRFTIAAWEMKLQQMAGRQEAVRERARASVARSKRGSACKGACKD